MSGGPVPPLTGRATRSPARRPVNLIIVLALCLVLLPACSDDDDEASEREVIDAWVVPDPVCRNNAVVETAEVTWRATDNLPVEWQGRDRVDGVIEAVGDDATFVADGARIALSANLTAPLPCVPWQEPQLAPDE